MSQEKKINNFFYLVAGAIGGAISGFILLFVFDSLWDKNIVLRSVWLIGGGLVHIEIFTMVIWLLASGVIGLMIAYLIVLKRTYKATFVSIEKLQEVSNSKTEFVFFIAHQLRSPLSSVRLSFLMFRDGDLGKISAKQKEIVQADIKEIDSLLGTIESLLDIPKIEQRQLAFNKETISLEKFLSLVEELLKGFSSLVKQKDISFDYTILPIEGSIFLDVDWEKIKQTLDNLFDNALHYTKSNGQISLSISLEKNFIVIALSDSGIGIPKLDQDKIFEKFYRASNAKAYSSKGTGIGLYLAKFMVESHGGKIWFDSKKDNGTTFYFSLPLKENVEEFLKNI